jgi:hypothetical protein
MSKSRKEHMIDLALLYFSAAAALIVAQAAEQVDLTLGSFGLYSFAGCAAGFGMREFVLRIRES